MIGRNSILKPSPPVELMKPSSGSTSASAPLHARLQGYLPAFVAFVIALALHSLAHHLMGARSLGAIPFFLYLLAFLVAAWCGYGPGIFITLVTICAMPYLFRPGFSIRTVDKGSLTISLLLSIVISGMAASRRRTEVLLRGMNRDLDERVADQTRLLSEQKAELETLYAQLPVGIAFLDTELRFVRVNEKLTSLHMTPPGTEAGRGYPQLVSDELASVMEPLHRRVLATGDAILDHEIPVLGAGTDSQFWSISCSPVTREGRLLGVQVIVQDVTERRKAEQALNHSNASLRRANEDLEQFAYSASHDLQEPLRSVAIYSQLLKQRFAGALGPEGELFVGYTLQGALRMSQLVRGLLDYTQASTSEALSAEPVRMKEAVDQALCNLEAAILESQASITTSELPEVTLPRVHLVQLFQNLIGNAIKYRKPEPPRIHISAVPHRDDSWLVAVEDNGIGIDPQYHQRIFGIFRRLHGQEEYPGTGIGLAMCRKIVEQHGGSIWVDSKAAEGATFRFTLPARASVAV